MMRFPGIINISRGACLSTGSIVEELHLGTRAALFCSKNAMRIAGEDVMKSMDRIMCDVFSPGSMEIEEMKKNAEAMRWHDFAVGIGGGVAIDTAKYTAYLAGKPWIAVPTIPSHDGVVSSRASLHHSGKRISVPASEPCAIIADIDVISKAPYRYIAAGAGDALSKISAVEDWKLADAEGKEKMHAVMASLSLLAADAVSRHAEQISAREDRGLEVLLWALTCSGFAMNIAGSSRPASGSEHNFSHALDELGSNALHGEQVAIGTVVMQHLRGQDWNAVKWAMEKLKMPARLSDIGIDEEMAVRALANARKIRDRYTILDKIDIDEAKAKEILEKTGVL